MWPKSKVRPGSSIHKDEREYSSEGRAISRRRLLIGKGGGFVGFVASALVLTATTLSVMNSGIVARHKSRHIGLWAALVYFFAS